MSVRFFVSGKSEPQGSTRAFVVKGRARVTSSNPNLNQWRDLIASEAQGQFPAPHLGPVHLQALFSLPKPRSYPKKLVPATKRPDLDKLVRAICDALTAIAWLDDSQVTQIHATKRYAEPDEPPGVLITIEAAA